MNRAEPRDAVDVGRGNGLGVVGGPVPVAPDHRRGLVASLLAALAEVEGLDRRVLLVVLDGVAAAGLLVAVLAEAGEAIGPRLATELARIHLLAAVLAENPEEDSHLDWWLLEKESECIVYALTAVQIYHKKKKVFFFFLALFLFFLVWVLC